MKEEINAINRNKTRELSDLPHGKKLIGVKWVYRIKYKPNGEISKYEARLVAKGYSQVYGVDYEEIFAPVARLETVRVLLAVAVQKQWPVFQLDVKSAFLNGISVYVAQPQGFEVYGQEHMVCKLNKAVYGLKQAPRAWYEKLDCYLNSQGFHRSEAEHTLYKKVSKEGDILLVCVCG